MGMIPLIRQGVLGVTTLFSLIVLAISANLISQAQRYFTITATFCGLGIAIGLISLVTLLVMLVVDIMLRGAFTSMIVVELAWLYILSILWVATAGSTATAYNVSFAACNLGNDGIYNGLCQQTQAIEAFSFLNFFIIFVYASVIAVMSVVAATRGERVWLSSVKESFGSLASPAQYPMAQYDSSAAPRSGAGPVAV